MTGDAEVARLARELVAAEDAVDAAYRARQAHEGRESPGDEAWRREYRLLHGVWVDAHVAWMGAQRALRECVVGTTKGGG